MPKRFAPYVVAGLIGAGALVAMLPLGTILGTGAFWRWTAGDAAMGLAGHLAFQAPGWHWPLLLAPDLVWPEGRSIELTDSNPLVSLLAKLLSALVGRPLNLLGAWLGVCWVLQPVAAVYALRGLRPAASIEAMASVAGLSLLCPAWLMRHNHINLLGHFLLLAALGLAIRMVVRARPGSWWPAGLLLTVAVLVHPYLFVFAAILLAAPVFGHARSWRTAGWYLAVCTFPVLLLFGLSGALGANAPGFGHYSMNLLSPIWPQRSGLFGANLPIIDATGGQYEGFNYLGGGVLLLLAAACLVLWRRPLRGGGGQQALRAVLITLAVLTLLALTPRIYAGSWLVLPLPRQPWRQILGAIQSSGRAFWPVGYALMLGAVACVDARLGRPARTALLAVAFVLQLVDSAPLRADSARFFSGSNERPPPFAIPVGATLLRIVPACDPDNAPADLLRVLAIRQGLHLADMRMARAPGGLACEASLSDGLETGLAAGEVRVFLPAALAAFRQDALGPGVICRLTPPGIVCSRGLVDPPPGPLAPPGAAVTTLSPGSLRDAVSFGWRIDGAGTAWSEGPQATLLFRLPAVTPDGSRRLTLDIEAIAAVAGGERGISVRVGDGPARLLTLPDLRRTRLSLTMPAGESAVPIRIVFDMARPADPGKRGIAAPVRRAALRLFGVATEANPG